MPIPTEKYHHIIDLDSNELQNARLYCLNTTARLALSLTSVHKGYPVYDITVLALYIWNGTTWTSGSGITSVSAGIGMSFATITSSGTINIDNTKVPYFASGFSIGFLKYDGSAWIFDNSTYLTSAVTSVATGTGLTGGSITTTGTISLNTKLAPADSLTGNAGKFLRVNAGETAVEYATTSSSGGIPHATASGTDTYTTTITGVIAYTDGDAYLIQFTNGNTGTSTLNINSLGAISLYRNNDGTIIGGDIVAGGEMLCVYDNTITGFRLIGTSPNALLSYVTNADSVAITKGMPVYAFGGQGDRLTVKRAFNTSDATSAQTVGVVVSSSIASNQKGIIIMQGLLEGLSIFPTSTWADGNPVYLGTTAGSITNVKQYAPNHLVYLGTVTNASNGSAGKWYVRVQNGYELDELHNVQAQTPTLKDTLWYDNTVSPAQWKTASITTILGYTPIQLSSLSGITPISYNNTTGVISMTAITANSIIGNNTGSSATPLALTATQVTAMLNVFSSILNGLVPLSGGGTTNFLRADGTWAAPSGGGGGITRSVNSISSGTTAGSAASTDYTYIVTGTTTLTLPTAVSNSNEYTVVRTGTGLVTVRTTSSQTIQGQLSLDINQQYVSFTLYSDGANWLIK